MFLNPLLQRLTNSGNAATYTTLFYLTLFTLKCTFLSADRRGKVARFHIVTEDLPCGFKPIVPSLLILEIFKPHGTNRNPYRGCVKSVTLTRVQPSAWFLCRCEAISRDPVAQVRSRKQQHSRAAIPPAFSLLYLNRYLRKSGRFLPM